MLVLTVSVWHRALILFFVPFNFYIDKNMDKKGKKFKDTIDTEGFFIIFAWVFTGADKVVDRLARGQGMPDKLGD